MIYGGPCVPGYRGFNVLTKWLRLFWDIQKVVEGIYNLYKYDA